MVREQLPCPRYNCCESGRRDIPDGVPLNRDQYGQSLRLYFYIFHKYFSEKIIHQIRYWYAVSHASDWQAWYRAEILIKSDNF